MKDQAAARDALLSRRLALVANISALTAEALRLAQKRTGIEMDVLRLELEITRSGGSAQLVQDLHEAEESVAAIEHERKECEERIIAVEGEVEDVDRALAATDGN
ncbi:MAG: hypothetical protein EOR51_11070 [Mesorhizobium sp.]|uniref:hypothetical protein n=1 Tax=Mesorhizobium sp. TaxID=1871066 RepID=UPI000FE5D456|nr:hypothetical protein [Mesorhizobium sp.]RWH90714.1 MAG: hypothetical protein EOQ88_33385 [Mesorhizobium sp.]RWK51611.1 MAG: hypothetical protein EOR48_25220 [Mesorhizobium sp.]RWK82676.1 MAG: hypothetical protein EOR51_11070 [Mesorhizobium sp.]RWK98865.1 MAG: hypothetical protein EOR55_34205 [Mesorhizobium sp.]